MSLLVLQNNPPPSVNNFPSDPRNSSRCFAPGVCPTFTASTEERAQRLESQPWLIDKQAAGNIADEATGNKIT
jgi:hypothetical protein